jgi:DNA-binding transcriptional ArsR family regulator
MRFDIWNKTILMRFDCSYKAQRMAVPISVIKRLERKRESVERRLQALEDGIEKAKAELAAIEEAQDALSQGRKVNLRDLLGEIRLSQKDYVLEAVRKRPQKGMTRAEIVEHIRTKRGLDISPSAVTTLLYSLRVSGLVDFDGQVWRALS